MLSEAAHGGQRAEAGRQRQAQQLAPMIDKLKALPRKLGRARRALADSGYLNEANVEHCAQAAIEPLIAMKRERHNASWRERSAEVPTLLPSRPARCAR